MTKGTGFGKGRIFSKAKYVAGLPSALREAFAVTINTTHFKSMSSI